MGGVNAWAVKIPEDLFSNSLILFLATSHLFNPFLEVAILTIIFSFL